jgi:hypothetical protein
LGWIRAEAYIDSGAFVSIFSSHEMEGLGLDYRNGKETLVTVGDGGLIPVYLFQLPTQIGPVRLNATIGFSPRLAIGFNLLGRQDIFTSFDITFSEAKQLVTFRPRLKSMSKTIEPPHGVGVAKRLLRLAKQRRPKS